MEAGYCSGKTTHLWGGSHKFDSHPVLKIPEGLDSVLDSAVKTGDQNKDQTGALFHADMLAGSVMRGAAMCSMQC